MLATSLLSPSVLQALDQNFTRACEVYDNGVNSESKALFTTIFTAAAHKSIAESRSSLPFSSQQVVTSTVNQGMVHFICNVDIKLNLSNMIDSSSQAKTLHIVKHSHSPYISSPLNPHVKQLKVGRSSQTSQITRSSSPKLRLPFLQQQRQFLQQKLKILETAESATNGLPEEQLPQSSKDTAPQSPPLISTLNSSGSACLATVEPTSSYQQHSVDQSHAALCSSLRHIFAKLSIPIPVPVPQSTLPAATSAIPQPPLISPDLPTSYDGEDDGEGYNEDELESDTLDAPCSPTPAYRKPATPNRSAKQPSLFHKSPSSQRRAPLADVTPPAKRRRLDNWSSTNRPASPRPRVVVDGLRRGRQPLPANKRMNFRQDRVAKPLMHASEPRKPGDRIVEEWVEQLKACFDAGAKVVQGHPEARRAYQDALMKAVGAMDDMKTGVKMMAADVFKVSSLFRCQLRSELKGGLLTENPALRAPHRSHVGVPRRRTLGAEGAGPGERHRRRHAGGGEEVCGRHESTEGTIGGSLKSARAVRATPLTKIGRSDEPTLIASEKALSFSSLYTQSLTEYEVSLCVSYNCLRIMLEFNDSLCRSMEPGFIQSRQSTV